MAHSESAFPGRRAMAKSTLLGGASLLLGAQIPAPAANASTGNEHISVRDFGAKGGDGVNLRRAWVFSIRHSMLGWNPGDGLRFRGWDGFIMDNWFSVNQGAGVAAHDENASVTFTANRVEWNEQENILITEPFLWNRVQERAKLRHREQCFGRRRPAATHFGSGQHRTCGAERQSRNSV